MEESIDPEQTCVSQRSHFEHEAVFMEQLSLTIGSETKEAEKALDVLKEIVSSSPILL
jgi:hypothetical protein